MPPVQIAHCGCQRYPLASRAPCGDLRAQLDDRVNGFHRERDFLEVFAATTRSEEHTSELQSLMRISYAVFCLKKKTIHLNRQHYADHSITYQSHYHSHVL